MKKNVAIYPGTFDPVTNGHLDILSRACRIFDLVIVAMAEKSPKSTILTLSERLDLFETVLKKRLFDCPVKVMAFQGLLINFAKKQNAQTLVRGLRAISDFEYEFQMALMNRHQAPDIETVFLMPDEKYVYLSSSIVKEIARLKGNLKNFLPPEVLTALKNNY